MIVKAKQRRKRGHDPALHQRDVSQKRKKTVHAVEKIGSFSVLKVHCEMKKRQKNQTAEHQIKDATVCVVFDHRLE